MTKRTVTKKSRGTKAMPVGSEIRRAVERANGARDHAATVIDDDSRSAAVDEFKQAKLALGRLLYLAAEYDAGFVTPKAGEFAEAALAANLHLHTAENMLRLHEGCAES
jgi:hypothetical protein